VTQAERSIDAATAATRRGNLIEYISASLDNRLFTTFNAATEMKFLTSAA
jgi:hypothetical protein